MDSYLVYNPFLPDVNNERQIKNATYAKNLASLESFVMVEFENDRVIIPKGSSVKTFLFILLLLILKSILMIMTKMRIKLFF